YTAFIFVPGRVFYCVGLTVVQIISHSIFYRLNGVLFVVATAFLPRQRRLFFNGIVTPFWVSQDSRSTSLFVISEGRREKRVAPVGNYPILIFFLGTFDI